MKITESRCVHSISDASCRACLDICPLNAWQFNDGSLDLDSEACDNCGLCAAACPQQALQFDWEKDLVTAHGTNLSLSCEYADNKTGLNIPCIHSVHPTLLAQLISQGVRHLSLSAGDCQYCPRLVSPSPIDKINQLLENYPKKQLRISINSPIQAKEQPNLGRRRLFKLSKPKAKPSHLPQYIAPLLALDSKQDKLPYSPEIDADMCSGCDACVNICPHQAIHYLDFSKKTKKIGEEKYFYHIKAERCTGCMLCDDICEDYAIEVHLNAISENITTLLTQHTCTQCKISFHYPKNRYPSDSLCPTCQRIPKKLDRIIM